MSTNHPDWPNASTTTTTLDKPDGILIYAQYDDGHIIVTDHVGLRYGRAKTLAEAAADWAQEVQLICSEPEAKLGGSLLAEVSAYKSALKGEGL